jgi:zinc resistance-associated protein
MQDPALGLTEILTMWKLFVAATVAGVIGGSSLLFAQDAQDDQDQNWQPQGWRGDQDSDWQSEYDHGPQWHPSAEDMSAFMDARIAALKAGLKLTSDQEKNWPTFESAIRDIAKAREERWAMRQQQQPVADPVERLQQRADALSKLATSLKGLADAEGPLYKSLDDAQKHRFEILAQGLRPHQYFGGGWNDGWGRHQHCAGGAGSQDHQ